MQGRGVSDTGFPRQMQPIFWKYTADTLRSDHNKSAKDSP